MILLEHADTYKWVLACVGLSLMCLGFWLAGYRYLTILVMILMSSGIYKAWIVPGDLVWESGWMWDDWRVSLTLIMGGSFVSLLITGLIVLNMVVAHRKAAHLTSVCETKKTAGLDIGFGASKPAISPDP